MRTTVAAGYSRSTRFRYPPTTDVINGTSVAPIIGTMGGAALPFMNEGVWIPDFVLYGEEVSDVKMYEDMLALSMMNLL